MLVKVYTDELILLKTAVKLLIYLAFTSSTDKSDKNMKYINTEILNRPYQINKYD